MSQPPPQGQNSQPSKSAQMDGLYSIRVFSRICSRSSPLNTSSLFACFLSKLSAFYSGLYGASILFSKSACQSKSRSQMCYLTSDGPFSPSLLPGFLCRSLLIKSAASRDQSSGKSLRLIQTCFAKIMSRISFRVLPTYGLRPNMNS